MEHLPVELLVSVMETAGAEAAAACACVCRAWRAVVDGEGEGMWRRLCEERHPSLGMCEARTRARAGAAAGGPWRDAVAVRSSSWRARGRGGRIVVQTEPFRGNMLVLSPPGSGGGAPRLVAHSLLRGAMHVGQPTFGPDGRLLACAVVLPAEEGAEEEEEGAKPRVCVAVVRADGGGEVMLHEVDPARWRSCFYLSWSPDGSRLAWLGSSAGRGGIALGVLDVAALEAGARPGLCARMLATSRALYFAWAPDSSRLLAHTDGGLGTFDTEDALAPRRPFPLPDGHDLGTFAAPVWTRRGHVVYVAEVRNAVRDNDDNDDDDDRGLGLATVAEPGLDLLEPSGDRSASRAQRIVVADAETGRPLRVVATAPAAVPVQLFASPDGQRLAYWNSNAYRLEVVSLDDGSGGGQGPDPDGPPSMRRARARRRCVAFADAEALCGAWWSPNSRFLLFVYVRDRAPRRSFAYAVWDSATRSRALFPLVRLTRVLQEAYLPFCSQYATNVSPWSPASDAFVYTAAAGEPGQRPRTLVQRLPRGLVGTAAVAFEFPPAASAAAAAAAGDGPSAEARRLYSSPGRSRAREHAASPEAWRQGGSRVAEEEAEPVAEGHVAFWS